MPPPSAAGKTGNLVPDLRNVVRILPQAEMAEKQVAF